MKGWIISTVFKWVFTDGLKSVEKLNWTTRTLELLYKQKEFKENWPTVCDGIRELMLDAADEATQAKEWTHA